MTFRPLLGRIFVLLLSALFGRAGASDDEFALSGYWPEFRTEYDINATAARLTDLMLHSIDPKSDGSIHECCLKDENFRMAREARAYKYEQTGQKLTLWLAVGGWGRSQSFEHLVEDEESRLELIHNLKDLCLKEGIDGVDFDWQLPIRPDDFMYYYRLIREAKKVFRRHNIMLSVALTKDHHLPTKMYKFVDRIHMISYEFDLMSGVYHADYDKVRSMIRGLITRNCPPEKMLLGIPLYGRKNHKPSDMRTIAELVDDHADGKTSSIVKADHVWDGYYFDSPNLIKKKVELAFEYKLGGMFFWELGQDKIDPTYGPGGIMTQAVQSAIRKTQKSLAEKETTVHEDL